MKACYIMVALLLAGIACNAQNTIDNQGRKQGHWIKTDKNGAKIYEGNFKDNKEIGTFEYYYPDGTLRIKNTYIIDGKLCSHEAYDEKGRLLAKGFYANKNRDSVWNFYTEKGNLIKIAEYNMGIKEGTHVIFNSNGDTAEVSNWKDNHRHGRWWKRIGKQGWITGNYICGGLEGILLEYDQQGKLCRKGNYHNGFKNGRYQFFENEVMTIDEQWNNGTLMERKLRMLIPHEQYISIYDIAYMLPKGQKQAIIYMKDGTKYINQESVDIIYSRVGNGVFSLANKKSRVMISLSCLKGIKQDSEGRDILDLDPNPEFAIFPDEDCIKMVKSHQNQVHGIGIEELE